MDDFREQYSLKNGDIICRLGNGFFSNQFKERASKEKIYSHIGIIELSNDSIFVLHAEASELTGIGSARRDPLETFLDKISIWGIYRTTYPDSIASKIISSANKYVENKTPFDLDFDSYNDNEVYCTELVAISINQAVDSTLIVPTLKVGSKYLFALDDIYLNEKLDRIY